MNQKKSRRAKYFKMIEIRITLSLIPFIGFKSNEKYSAVSITLIWHFIITSIDFTIGLMYILDRNY